MIAFVGAGWQWRDDDLRDQARHSCLARVATSRAWNGADEAERLDGSIKRIYSKWTAPFPSPRSGDADRFGAVAYVASAKCVLTLVYVVRQGRVRCISYRRSSERERKEYEAGLERNRPPHE